MRGFAASAAVYLRPAGIVSGEAARGAIAEGTGLPLAGGPLAFTACEVFARVGARRTRRAVAATGAVRAWADAEEGPVGVRARRLLANLAAERPALAGLELHVPQLLGIVNVTPDSFYDGGIYARAEDAAARGIAMLAEGASVLDVGGESTRPGAALVPEAEELARVLPVVEALAAHGAPVSIDTRHAGVMVEAVQAGAVLINDVAALSEPGALDAAADLGVPVVLMHSNADPRTMQDNPEYDDVVLDVFDYLDARIEACGRAGIPQARLIADPGIGFAKTALHNAQLFERLSIFHGLGCPVLLGASRKSFVGRFSEGEAPQERLAGSLAAAMWGLSQGCQLLRVHDVAETAQALRVWSTAADARQLPT